MIPLRLRSFLNRATVATVAVLSFHRRTAAVCAFSTVDVNNMFHATSDDGEKLIFYHVQEAESTQDLAKTLIERGGAEDDHLWVVTTDNQTHGRGTTGRTWISRKGNVFLTIAVPMTSIPVPITLLPLQMGVLVAERLDKIYHQLKPDDEEDGSERLQPTVKWPNDVLFNDEKIAGILIESHVVENVTWLLVGIGVNLLQTPQVPTEGPDKGRPATCLQHYVSHDVLLPESLAEVFSHDLAVAFEQWLDDSDVSAEQVRSEWKRWANWAKPLQIRETGEAVFPMDIEADGRLRVKEMSGKERLLVADYLY
uniref:BPL/LPL catalytic domain-containing protein n=1 Tax=Cyclophora tenuis TaxID=216820 RepID=A0A7S1GL90_CYCTE|mmetsp:Transcript_21479/g.36584  ORF Transcript_21479/g.36584 Transcript_21479/m.36584 type:complete len:310 (+) Transcript_21479:682-1611(+)